MLPGEAGPDTGLSGTRCPQSKVRHPQLHIPLGFGSPLTSPAPVPDSPSLVLPSSQPGLAHMSLPHLHSFKRLPTFFLPPRMPPPTSSTIFTDLDSVHTSRCKTYGTSSRKPSPFLIWHTCLPPLPTPRPSSGPQSTREENELLEERKHARHLIFFPTIPALFLAQVGVQTIPDD